MTVNNSTHANASDPKYRFLERRKLLTARTDVEQLANDIRRLLAAKQNEELYKLLHSQYPADHAPFSNHRAGPPN